LAGTAVRRRGRRLRVGPPYGLRVASPGVEPARLDVGSPDRGRRRPGFSGRASPPADTSGPAGGGRMLPDDDARAAAAALALLPKVELHCHVEGTMRPGTVVELAGRNGLALPSADPTRLYHYVSLDDFLRVFWLVQSTLGGRADWARLAYESVLDAAGAGVVYRETFFTPARHLAAGQVPADIVAGPAEGLSAGEDETGVRVMLICDMDRAYGGAAGRELVERLVELRRAGAPGTEGVLGTGLGSTELGVDPVDFADAYQLRTTAGRLDLLTPNWVWVPRS